MVNLVHIFTNTISFYVDSSPNSLGLTDLKYMTFLSAYWKYFVGIWNMWYQFSKVYINRRNWIT